MTIIEATEQLRKRMKRLKDKYGVSYREQGRRANISQSQVFNFLHFPKAINPTVRTLARLESVVAEIEADRAAR